MGVVAGGGGICLFCGGGLRLLLVLMSKGFDVGRIAESGCTLRDVAGGPKMVRLGAALIGSDGAAGGGIALHGSVTGVSAVSAGVAVAAAAVAVGAGAAVAVGGGRATTSAGVPIITWWGPGVSHGPRGLGSPSTRTVSITSSTGVSIGDRAAGGGGQRPVATSSSWLLRRRQSSPRMAVAQRHKNVGGLDPG